MNISTLLWDKICNNWELYDQKRKLNKKQPCNFWIFESIGKGQTNNFFLYLWWLRSFILNVQYCQIALKWAGRSFFPRWVYKYTYTDLYRVHKISSRFRSVEVMWNQYRNNFVCRTTKHSVVQWVVIEHVGLNFITSLSNWVFVHAINRKLSAPWKLCN